MRHIIELLNEQNEMYALLYRKCDLVHTDSGYYSICPKHEIADMLKQRTLEYQDMFSDASGYQDPDFVVKQVEFTLEKTSNDCIICATSDFKLQMIECDLYYNFDISYRVEQCAEYFYQFLADEHAHSVLYNCYLKVK